MSSNSTDRAEKLDPRVKRTRQLLEQAFLELINEKGFQAINVQDITERAGLNRATFYSHFEDKYGLLDYSIRESFRKEIQNRLLDACHFSLENLRRLILAVCEYVGQLNAHCQPPQQQFETLIETQVKSQVYGLLLAWLEKETPPQRNSAITPERAATATTWAIYGLAQEWSRNKRTPPVEQYATEVLPLIAANLGQSVELA